MNRLLAAALAPLALVLASSAHAGLLMIPDSGRDRILTLSAQDGSIVNPNFVPDTRKGGGSSFTGIHAIDSGQGTIFLSDQIDDSVLEFRYDGTFVRKVVGAAQGLDNVRGIAVHGGRLYVTVAGGALTGTIQSFNLDGTGQTTWATLPSGASPWSLVFRTNDVLISDSGDDDIWSYSLSGTSNGLWHASNGVSGIDFPQQLHQQANGRILAGGFSPPAGIYEYDATGVQSSFYSLPTAIRGVYRLGNGNILWTGGTQIGVFDPVAGSSSIILDDAQGSFRFISAAPVPEPASLAVLGLGALALLRRRR